MTTRFQKPRARLTPSPRDQQIYLDYQVHGLKQTQLANKHGVTQRRISQILHRVEAWLDATKVEGPKSNVEGPENCSAANPTFDFRPSTFDSAAARERLEFRL